METKDLFHVVDNGYSCEEVEKYIERLKSEYKKVHEFAKATEENNAKLKKICRVLSEENKKFKAEGAAAPAAAPVATEPVKAIPEGAAECVEKIGILAAELIKENDALKAKLQ